MKIVLPTLHVRRSTQAIPLAAGCLAAALPAGLRRTTTLVDLFAEQTDQEMIDAILDHDPDCVGIPLYTWNRIRLTSLTKLLRQQRPNLILVAGGPEVTGDPNGLRDAAPWDALVLGEGEGRFAALADNLLAGRSSALDGVILPGVRAEAAPGGTEAPESGFPSPWLTGTLDPTPGGGVLWEVARGCAFTCDYCFDSRGQKKVQFFDRDRLTAELEIFRDVGVSHVWVLDATFNYPPERGVELLELLLEKAPELHYHLEAKVDFLDRQTADLLGRLNCSVQLGLQSIHEQVLKAVHRPLDFDNLSEQIHLLDAEGVTYGFDLIYGLPEDNFEGFRTSLDAVLRFSPNHLHLFPIAVLPGTRLAQTKARYGLVAEQQPPYEIIQSASWSQEDLVKSKQMAAAVDLFYNTGRAVAFFPALLRALDFSATELIEDFVGWLENHADICIDDWEDESHWTGEAAYRMQQGYLEWRLKESGLSALITAVLDLLCYHFNYAETLLGAELLPAREGLFEHQDFWETPLKRTEHVRLVPFAYEIFDLLEVEGMDLSEFISLFRPVGSVALFMRRNDEVICESLEEDFLRLLQKSDGTCSPREIYAGRIPQTTGEELVAFAVGEGLLTPAPPST